MDIEKTVQYWLEGAKSDHSAAEALFRETQNPQCLFWCHLVLEKLLKAHVVKATQKQAAFTHNLVLLAEMTELPFSEEQKGWLRDISGFNVMGRYPDEMMDFVRKCTPEFTQKYFSITQNFYQWLTQKIS